MHPVSVIIPNYNHARFLKQRIDSVLNQTHQNFEIIILDDCSADNSREIIEAYRDNSKVAHIVYNQINSGSTFKQWKKGIELAQSEYLWIAESDDVSDEKFLEKLMQSFSNNPDLILSYCQSMMINENGNHLQLSNWTDEIDNKKWKHDYVEEAYVEIKNFLSFRNTIVNASAVVFKKPHDINILDESSKMKMLGDWLFWRKLLDQNGKISFISSPLNFFRTHDQSTRAATTKEKELLRMKEYHRLIVPQYLSIYDNRYDWMIEEWFRNRTVLKGSVYYFFPNVPLILKIRFLFLLVVRIKRRFLKLFN